MIVGGLVPWTAFTGLGQHSQATGVSHNRGITAPVLISSRLRLSSPRATRRACGSESMLTYACVASPRLQLEYEQLFVVSYSGLSALQLQQG